MGVERTGSTNPREPVSGPEPLPPATGGEARAAQPQPGAGAARDGVDSGGANGSPAFEVPGPLTALADLLEDGLKEALQQTLWLASAGVITPPARPSRTGAAAPTAAAPPPGAAQIGKNLDGITVQSHKTTVMSRAPWELGELVPQNNTSKRDAYKAFVAADKAFEKAEQKLAVAQAKVAEKEAAVAEGKPGAAKGLEAARKTLVEAEKGLVAAQEKLEAADSKLRKVLRSLAPGHAAEIDALELRKRAVERDVSTVTVGGTQVQMHDAIDAYSTVSQDGLVAHARGEDRRGVDAQVDGAAISDSKKAIFKSVSSNEGTFSEANTYDLAGLTYGFIQMTSKGHEGSLGRMFEHAKTTDPETFKRLFQDYGIDYDTRKDEFTLTLPGGETLRGEAAVNRISTDPKYVGVLCAAGTDPRFQNAQITFASKKLDAALNKAAEIDTKDGQHHQVKASDILTSELAVGLYFDRCVQNGEGLSRAQGSKKGEAATGAIGQLDRVITAYLNKHPDADLTDAKVRREIELDYIAWAQQNYGDRAESFTVYNASSDPGSYKK
jgi:hypothetical protein